LPIRQGATQEKLFLTFIWQLWQIVCKCIRTSYTAIAASALQISLYFFKLLFLALWCKSEKKHKYAQKAGAGKNGLVLVHSPFFTYSLAEAAV
jgi:hypothetical protein